MKAMKNIEEAADSARRVIIIDDISTYVEYEDEEDTESSITMPSQTRDKSVPCSGFCQDHSDTTAIMRDVGNDRKKTIAAIKKYLDDGLDSQCRKCSNKYFDVSEALEHHGSMLKAIERQDDRKQLIAARKRGEVLKKLGYKIA